jgi:hypothetical protein
LAELARNLPSSRTMTIRTIRGDSMSAVGLQDRRVKSDRRAVSRGTTAVPAARANAPTRRQIWIALTLYCTAFWGLVGYAVYDIFAR